MKISSGVNLNSITYLNELKTQNESPKMETYNNTDIVNISKEGVSKWQEYLSKKNDSLYQMVTGIEYATVKIITRNTRKRDAIWI